MKRHDECALQQLSTNTRNSTWDKRETKKTRQQSIDDSESSSFQFGPGSMTQNLNNKIPLATVYIIFLFTNKIKLSKMKNNLVFYQSEIQLSGKSKIHFKIWQKKKERKIILNQEKH